MNVTVEKLSHFSHHHHAIISQDDKLTPSFKNVEFSNVGSGIFENYLRSVFILLSYTNYLGWVARKKMLGIPWHMVLLDRNCVASL